MKFPGNEIIKAYKTALDGNVSYNATNVPVFTRVPTDEVPPYIYISDFTDFTDDEITCKDHQGHNSTTLFDIVTIHTGGSGSTRPSNVICDAIVQIIGDGITIGADFYHLMSNIDSYTVLTEERDDSLVIRGLLRMRNEIHEL